MLLTYLRHEDLPFNEDPMGESLIYTNQTHKVWIPDKECIVLGLSQKIEKECLVEHLNETSIPIYKRKGGGGAVLLSPEVICYAIKIKRASLSGCTYNIPELFTIGNQVLQQILARHFKIQTKHQGISDICIKDKKIMGSSLYLSKYFALYYSSIIFHSLSDKISYYLSHPSKEPDYRLNREHKNFISSLDQYLPRDITKKKMLQFILDEIYQLKNLSNSRLPNK